MKFEQMGISFEYLLIGIMSALLLLTIINFILFIVTKSRQKKLQYKYQQFMKGADGESLEETVLERFNEVDKLKEKVDNIDQRLDEVNDTLLFTYQKIGVVKYDAFKEMGGDLSFVVTLLDQSNNGFMINAIHSREGCYTYVKEIKKGESDIVLSEEEQKSLNIALDRKY